MRPSDRFMTDLNWSIRFLARAHTLKEVLYVRIRWNSSPILVNRFGWDVRSSPWLRIDAISVVINFKGRLLSLDDDFPTVFIGIAIT